MATPKQRPEITGLLMIIFLVHLILSAWGMQSIFNAPTSYLYTNTIFLLSLLWAINGNASMEAIAMSLLINFTLLNLEIVTFTLYWPRVPWQGHYLGFAITNSSLRPFSTFLLYRLFVDLDENCIGLGGFLYNALGYTATITTRICDVRISAAGGIASGVAGRRTGPGVDRYRYEDIDQEIRRLAQQQQLQNQSPQVQYNSSQEEISISRTPNNNQTGGGGGGIGGGNSGDENRFLF